MTTHVGLGHAGIITRGKFSPDARYLVTVSSDGGIFRWKNPYSSEQQKAAKEMDDVVSVHSEPGESKQAKGKELEECITKSMKVRCKCGKTTCSCPKMKVTTTKRCRCIKPRCNCTLTVVRPDVKKNPDRKIIRVPSSEIGKNNIFGDYCPMPSKGAKKS